MCCCRSCRQSTTSSPTRNTGPARSSRRWWLRATSGAKLAGAPTDIDMTDADRLTVTHRDLPHFTRLQRNGMRCNKASNALIAPDGALVEEKYNGETAVRSRYVPVLL